MSAEELQVFWALEKERNEENSQKRKLQQLNTPTRQAQSRKSNTGRWLNHDNGDLDGARGCRKEAVQRDAGFTNSSNGGGWCLCG
ncbi:hypothetical protein AAHA92_17233 [Salvia divinorum]|uniref:Uncharacterized protein n=1 Tax=Salvia divinorum TaxID=28513 RepID=A0ABD1GY53_SALDI